MSLLQDAMEKCIMMDRTTVDDGYGGFVATWKEGASFRAAMALDNSIEAQIAKAQGITGVYTVTTQRGVNLQYHDVFRRVSDGKTFRVVTDGDDSKTPASASLDMRNVRAEEWELNG